MILYLFCGINCRTMNNCAYGYICLCVWWVKVGSGQASPNKYYCQLVNQSFNKYNCQFTDTKTKLKQFVDKIIYKVGEVPKRWSDGGAINTAKRHHPCSINQMPSPG